MSFNEVDFAEADDFVAPKGGDSRSAKTMTGPGPGAGSSKSSALGKKLLPAGSTGRSLAPPGVVRKKSNRRERTDDGKEESNGSFVGNAAASSKRHDLSSPQMEEYRSLASESVEDDGVGASEEYQSYVEFSEKTRAALEGDLAVIFEQLDAIAAANAGGHGAADEGGVEGVDDGDNIDDPDGLLGTPPTSPPAPRGSDPTTASGERLIQLLERRHVSLEEQLTAAWDEAVGKEKALREGEAALRAAQATREESDAQASRSLALAARQLGE